LGQTKISQAGPHSALEIPLYLRLSSFCSPSGYER
jgi:hypothetical protein